MGKNSCEILNLDPKMVPAFRQAVENVSGRTFISNTSIFVDDDGTLKIYETRAKFLLDVGMEYQKLTNK